MALTRIQASDFQEDGIEGNLSKLETIAKSANSRKSAGVDLVGDIFDAHSLDKILAKYKTDANVRKLQESSPEVKALLDEREAFIDTLEKRYGESYQEKLMKKELAPEELKTSDHLSKRMQELGIIEAINKDLLTPFYAYYQECAKRISSIQCPVYAVRGNNDLNFMQNIVKARYPELDKKMIEDGQFRIIGMNNTNHPGEVIGQYGEMIVPSDSAEAYKLYNLKSTGGKRANLIMMHNPPYVPGGEEVMKLVEEHAPSKGYLLVEQGHLDEKARLEVRATKDGRKMVFARSSKHVFFEHTFDDNGNYQFSDVYRYKLN